MQLLNAKELYYNEVPAKSAWANNTLVWKASGQSWEPIDLGSSLILWLDASDTSTISLNVSSVSEWRDKSVYGHDTTQTTAAAQPSYVLSGINSKPSLLYTVAAQRMNLTVPLSVVQEMAVVSVFSRALSGIQSIDIASNNINSTPFGIWWGTTNFVNGGLGAGVDTIFGFRPSLTGDFVSVSKRTSTTAQVWLDGTKIGTDKTALSATRQFETIGYRPGSSQTHNGYLAEIVVITNDSSIETQQKAEGYLAHKWGLVSKLPVNHPYKYIAP
jgi:hypothetical protein